MKRFIVVALLVAMASTALAQETTKEIRYIPEKGDIRVGLAWGWAMRMYFESRPNFGHTKPIMPPSSPTPAAPADPIHPLGFLQDWMYPSVNTQSYPCMQDSHI